MAASPSPSPSPAAQALFAVWLHDANGNRVALVDVPMYTGVSAFAAVQSLPAIVQYQGNYYFWSTVFQRYVQEPPYPASADVGLPLFSVVCNPQQ